MHTLQLFCTRVGINSSFSFFYHGVAADTIRLSLFSFSLSGEAKRWLHSFKGNSLKSWDEVVEKFLKKYFPKSKTAEGKADISSFHQFPDESLSKALERFRSLLRKTPTHSFSLSNESLPVYTSNLTPLHLNK